jgi:hypothetical protein
VVIVIVIQKGSCISEEAEAKVAAASASDNPSGSSVADSLISSISRKTTKMSIHSFPAYEESICTPTTEIDLDSVD